jgi:hypothetical protein
LVKDAICDESIDTVLRVPCVHAEFVGSETRIDDRLVLQHIEEAPACASSSSACCLLPLGADSR